MNHRIVIVIMCGLLLWGGVSVSANNGLRPWDHPTNPAFFAFGQREYAELGFSTDASFGNSVMSLSDVFSETLVIDLDEIYENTPDRGMRLAAALDTEAHLSVKLPRIGFGFFNENTSLTRVTIPRDFIGLITQGNELDGDYSGSTELVQRSFTRAGTYATYDALGFVFAGKLGAFAPAIYNDTNTTADFELATSSDGTVEGEVSASGDIYTSFGDDGLDGVGFNIGLGVVRPDQDGKPLYGGALNSIPLVAARPGYIFELEEYRYTFTGGDLLDSIQNDKDPFDTDNIEGDANTRALDPDDRPRVHMPLSLSGFYRFAVPLVDVIPSAEIVFGDYPRLNAEVNVEGNFFPLNMLSVSVGHHDFFWHAGGGLRIPLRPFELGLQVRSAAPEIAGVFQGRGLGGSFSLAIGY